MPWTDDDYPSSWKNLDAEVRDKAIEIGNALLSDGMDKQRAIPIALSQARESVDDAEASDGQWVVPHDDGWAVKTENAERPRRVHDTKQAAIDDAVDYAKRHDTTVTVMTSGGSIQDRQSFAPRV
jgi:uncharacterized protein YdaT